LVGEVFVRRHEDFEASVFDGAEKVAIF